MLLKLQKLKRKVTVAGKSSILPTEKMFLCEKYFQTQYNNNIQYILI